MGNRQRLKAQYADRGDLSKILTHLTDIGPGINDAAAILKPMTNPIHLRRALVVSIHDPPMAGICKIELPGDAIGAANPANSMGRQTRPIKPLHHSKLPWDVNRTKERKTKWQGNFFHNSGVAI
jgi:hypothetical protein